MGAMGKLHLRTVVDRTVSRSSARESRRERVSNLSHQGDWNY